MKKWTKGGDCGTVTSSTSNSISRRSSRADYNSIKNTNNKSRFLFWGNKKNRVSTDDNDVNKNNKKGSNSYKCVTDNKNKFYPLHRRVLEEHSLIQCNHRRYQLSKDNIYDDDDDSPSLSGTTISDTLEPTHEDCRSSGTTLSSYTKRRRRRMSFFSSSRIGQNYNNNNKRKSSYAGISSPPKQWRSSMRESLSDILQYRKLRRSKGLDTNKQLYSSSIQSISSNPNDSHFYCCTSDVEKWNYRMIVKSPFDDDENGKIDKVKLWASIPALVAYGIILIAILSQQNKLMYLLPLNLLPVLAKYGQMWQQYQKNNKRIRKKAKKTIQQQLRELDKLLLEPWRNDNDDDTDDVDDREQDSDNNFNIKQKKSKKNSKNPMTKIVAKVGQVAAMGVAAANIKRGQEIVKSLGRHQTEKLNTLWIDEMEQQLETYKLNDNYFRRQFKGINQCFIQETQELLQLNSRPK